MKLFQFTEDNGGTVSYTHLDVYKRQVVVRVDEDNIGVSRECCVSPTLFNIYAEKLTEEALGKARRIVVEDENNGDH